MNSFWQSLTSSARLSLAIGVAIVISVAAASFWWVMRPNYQVLFSDLKLQDVAVMTAELEKLKIPYSLDDSGTVIMVDKSQVHTTRIKLMGQDLPLHGAVGFELFNNTDFGMTEFAQKINYQRALQGELTRTVLSLSEIRDVRVHLALPEQGLFKQVNSKPKAALTLTMHDGKNLRPEQVVGIQRLVAAATPGMSAQDVTVLDKQGVALSSSADDSGDASTGSSGVRLDLVRATENHLLRKAGAVLDKTFGVGQALASVDVTLNMDQVRTTTEDLLPAPSRTGDSKGIIVKERESIRDSNIAPLDVGKSSGSSGTSQREVDYQVGRRVEQVVSSAGAIKRIQVVAVVRQTMDEGQEEQLRRILAAAVGASIERGDTVVVQSLRTWIPPADSTSSSLTTPADGQEKKSVPIKSEPVISHLIMLIIAFVVLVVGLGLIAYRKRNLTLTPQLATLTVAERQALLLQVKEWLQSGSARNEAVSDRSAGSTRS